MKQEKVTSHFDVIAPQYDLYKKKNPFYYNAIKRKLKNLIPPGKKILDFGCGTGKILSHLIPSEGIGYDLSTKMIQIAKRKFKSKRNLAFVTSLNQIPGTFDYILMVDVIEHLAEPRKAFESLKKFMNEDTYLIVSFVDSSWESILLILEKLNLKMPEGPHRRMKESEVIQMGEKTGFKLKNRKKAQIFSWLPVYPLTFLTFKKKLFA